MSSQSLNSSANTNSVSNLAAASVAFQAAIQAHQARRFVDAERGYLQALAHDANYADAYHMLGILRQEMGNRAEGESLVRRAISIREDASFYSDLGNILNESGRSQEAEAAYRHSLQLDPEAAGTHYNLAIVCDVVGRKQEAVECYRRALIYFPDFAEAHDNLGMLLHEDKRYDEAEIEYRCALAIRPNFFEACVNLGKLQEDTGRLAEAELSYRQAITLDPSLPEAHNNLGALLKGNKQLQKAEEAYLHALILRPDYDSVYTNIGHVFQELARNDAAEQMFRRAIFIKPHSDAAYNGLGTCLHAKHRLQDAEEAYRLAIDIAPTEPEAHNNLGNLLREMNRLEEADAIFRRTLQLVENDFDAGVNYALLLLHMGDFARGWHYYEDRLKHRDREAQRPTTQIRWDGKADLRGKTILLYGEQGMGDTLQFVRYATMVAERGAIVYLDVQRPLRSLAGSCPGVAGVFSLGEPAPPFEYHAPLLSLPYILKTELGTIPAQIPYLRSSPAKTMYWRAKLGSKKVPRIGLTWAGDPRKHMLGANALDRQRSMRFEQLLPLLEVPGVEFFSLQLGEDAVRQLDGHPQVVDMTADIRDFEDTAAIVESLDLVICVDTSVCHLAGAVGRPVWMFNRYNTCWRWLNDRSDSPWYPTVRIFRQPAPGDWGSVVADMKAALVEWARMQAELPTLNSHQ